MALKDQPTLPQSMEATARIPLVSDGTKAGQPVSVSIAELVEIQERVNPFVFSTERILLVEYSGVDSANRASESSNNNLAIRTGSTRHSFDDDYYMFEILQSDALGFPSFVSAERFNATSSSDRVAGGAPGANTVGYSIWRASATAFRVDAFYTQNTTNFIRAIYGHRMEVERNG